MDRPERIGLKTGEALCLLKNRNLKDKENIYLEKFIEFVNKMEEVEVVC